MNDRRFENLRKKLDQLGYTQTMNPDSVELVQKLWNSLFKSMTEADQLRKKLKQQNNAKTGSIDSQEYIESLISERDELKKQLQQSRSGMAKKENDERLKNMLMTVNNLKIKLEQSTLQYEREIKKLSSEVASLQLGNSQLQGENQQLRKMSAQDSNQTERYTAELTSLVEKKGRQIRELEDASSKLRIKVQVLERNLEDTKFSSRDNKEESKTEADKFHNILKQELSESEARVRQLKTELDTTRDEVDDIRRELRRSREEIIILKKEECTTKNLENIGRAGKQKMQQFYDEARDQLNEKIDELKIVKDRLDEEQRQKGKLEIKVKELFNKIKFLSDKNSDLQTEIEHISSKSTIQIKRVRQLEAVNASLEKQLKDDDDSGFSQAREQTLKDLKEEQVRTQQLRKQTVIKQRQLKLFEEELKILKEQGQQRAIERDKAQLNVKKLQTIITEGSRNLQAVQLQKEQLMKENHQLRNGKHMLTSADSSARSQIFLLKERLQGSEGQVDELRSILNSQQLRNKDIEAEISRLQANLVKSQEKNIEIFQDNRLMVGQIKILEQRKNQLHDKVKSLQERTHLQMQGTSQSRREMEDLISKNDELISQLARKDQALRVLDSEKDEIQNELDQQTEERSRLKEQLSVYEKDMRSYNRNNDEKQHIINELQRKLSRSQSVREDIERQHDRLVEQDVKVRDRLASTQAELRQIKNQIDLLASSNQMVQKEVERGRNKVTELDKKLKDRTRESEQERQRATALNILNTQIQEQLERQRAELARLTGFVRQLEDANNQMYNLLEGKDQDIQEMSRALEQNQRKQEQYIHEINSYQRQLQNLTHDIESMQNQIHSLSGEKESLRAQRNWKKEVSTLTQDWRTKQEERYIDLQHEYHRVKHQNQQLRQKCRHLEDLLSEQRRNVHTITQNLGTPTRTVLVESRVQSYHQSQNFNNSNVYKRSRHQSVQQIPNSQSRQSAGEDSAEQSLRQIQKTFLQAQIKQTGKIRIN